MQNRGGKVEEKRKPKRNLITFIPTQRKKMRSAKITLSRKSRKKMSMNYELAPEKKGSNKEQKQTAAAPIFYPDCLY